MSTEKLRLNRDIVVLDVNDEGETITLQLADQSIPYKLKKLVRTLEEKSNELAELANTAEPDDIIDRQYEFDCYVRKEFDDIFGEGTCRKVFGNILPPIWQYIDFINAITPYFQKYSEQRADRLSKYSPNRTGSVT